MKLKDAYRIVCAQLEDYKTTMENYEAVFPGALSAYRTDVEAYTVAVAAIQQMIDDHGEDYEP